MQRHVNIVNTNIVNTNPTMQGRQRKEELAHQFALCSTGTSVTTRCNHGLGKDDGWSDEELCREGWKQYIIINKFNNHPNVQCLHFLHLHRHLIRQFPAQFPRFAVRNMLFHQEFKECMEVIEEQLRDSNGMSGAWL